MHCAKCSRRCYKHGFTRRGTRRYRCVACRKTYSEHRKTIGNMYLSFENACLAATLLVEGNSISSTARIVGVKDETILSLLSKIGPGCSDLLRSRVRDFSASHLELDEIWTLVAKKQKRVTAADPPDVGDAYAFIALDRESRAVVAWRLGKRDLATACRLVLDIRNAVTADRFQISTDGWEGYETAIELGLAGRADYARIVKVVGPAHIEPMLGNPDMAEVGTSYIERYNCTLRQWNKRFTRKSLGFSKSWTMLKCALGLTFADYNFCRVHRTLRKTPAHFAGITDHAWSMAELLEKACVG